MIKNLLNGSFEEKQNCCGCTACSAICPKHCITMQRDSEGFLYPVVNEKECVGCGQCERVCRIKNPVKEAEFEQKAFVVQLLDETQRRESTSGGAFTAIARYILEKNGVVYGAAYDDDLRVCHFRVCDAVELRRFRNSKYVQSFLGDAFSKVKEDLKQGRWVCFSGTPCQVEGLKSYLGRDYETLVTVDVVCRAVGSPTVFESYMKMQKKKYGDNISAILFRDKHHGYKYSNMTVRDNEGRVVYARGVESDPMLRAFFSNICDRPSCYNCLFKKRYRVSDFTIWDCFQIHDINSDMDDDKGTTNMLIHTDKGRRIFGEINSVRRYECRPEDILVPQSAMFKSVPYNFRREAFMKDFSESPSGSQTLIEYFPDSYSVKIKRIARLILVKTGMHDRVKRIYKKVKGS